MANLLSIPTEIQQKILVFLPTDKDVVSFARTCKAASSVVNGETWRLRMRDIFDPIITPVLGNGHSVQLLEYRLRQYLFNNFHSVANEEHPTFLTIIGMVKRLILESDAQLHHDSAGNEVVYGKNLSWLRDYFAFRGPHPRKEGCDLLDNDARDDLDSRHARRVYKKYALQLALLHLYLDPTTNLKPIARFDSSQMRVYRSYTDEPILEGPNNQSVNVCYLAHVINFARHHLKATDGSGQLAHLYRGFDPKQYPKPWLGKLQGETQALQGNYLGFWAGIDDSLVRRFRTGVRPRSAVSDDFDTDGSGFQICSLISDLQGHEELHYPEKFESIFTGKPYASHRHPDGTTKLATVKDFYVLRYSPDMQYVKNSFHGRTYALPPQFGIPGFQYLVMIEEDEIRQCFWVYEGIAIPGGQIILGRWIQYDPFLDEEVEEMSGPFIYWKVGDHQDPNAKDALDAMAYLNNLNVIVDAIMNPTGSTAEEGQNGAAAAAGAGTSGMTVAGLLGGASLGGSVDGADEESGDESGGKIVEEDSSSSEESYVDEYSSSD